MFIGVEDYSPRSIYVYFVLIYNHKMICKGMHNFISGVTYLKENHKLTRNKWIKIAYKCLSTNDMDRLVFICSPKKYNKKYKKTLKWK